MPAKRLEIPVYTGFVRVSFAICTCYRKNIFIKRNESFTNKCIYALSKSCEKHGAKNYVYCFMPDHVHILLQGEKEKANLLNVIHMFKQMSAYEFRLAANKEKLWQDSYYDHVLRSDEEILTQVKYIAENPVRKKLVSNHMEYPFTGSVSFDLKELLRSM